MRFQMPQDTQADVVQVAVSISEDGTLREWLFTKDRGLISSNCEQIST